VNHGSTVSARAKSIAGVLSLLAMVCALSQAQPPAQSRTVPLVSDTCPEVHPGDKISLDSNPLFDPIWPVTGLRGFGLTFAKLADDGVHLTRNELLMGGRHSGVSIAALGNGYFHIEMTVPPKRFIKPGTYVLVGATANADVVPDYADQPPQMTASPVEERYCVTIVKSPASLPSQPGG